MKKIILFFFFSITILLAIVNVSYPHLRYINTDASYFLNSIRSDFKNYKTIQSLNTQTKESIAEKEIRLLYLNQQIEMFNKKLEYLKRKQLMLKEYFIPNSEKKLVKNTKTKIKPIAQHLLAKINLSKQKMQVYRGKKLLYNWKISSGKKGFDTPRGQYHPTKLSKLYLSHTYNNARMPYAVFFKSAYAIHGTESIKLLGKRASHGCIRLHTNDAKKFYNLVKKIGTDNTSIDIVN